MDMCLAPWYSEVTRAYSDYRQHLQQLKTSCHNALMVKGYISSDRPYPTVRIPAATL